MNNRILLVEDSPTQAQQAQLLLARAGYELEMAENGRVGLEKALANPPDLVIADISMPVMDGYEMTRRLKADPRMAAVPVLMLTAKDQPLDIIRGLEVGADQFITKPYDDEYLVQRIQALFRQLEETRAGHLPEQQALERFSQEIVITKSREQILQLLLQAMARILDCEAMALLVRRLGKERSLFVLSFYPLEDPMVAEMGTRMADLLNRIEAKVPLALPVQTVRIVAEPAQIPPTGKTDLMRSFLHAPLLVQGQVSGLLGIFGSRPDVFDIQHVRFLFDMGQAAAEALSRVRPE